MNNEAKLIHQMRDPQFLDAVAFVELACTQIDGAKVAKARDQLGAMCNSDLFWTIVSLALQLVESFEKLPDEGQTEDKIELVCKAIELAVRSGRTLPNTIPPSGATVQ